MSEETKPQAAPLHPIQKWGFVVSLIILFVGVFSLWRTTERWQVEDARIGPMVEFSIHPTVVVDGWRDGGVGIANRLSVPIIIESIELLKPRGAKLALRDDQQQTAAQVSAPLVSTSSVRLNFGDTVPPTRPPSWPGAWGTNIWTKSTAPSGTDVVLRFTMREVPYPHRKWTSETSARIP
jgi:hypothetical protein